MNTIVSEASTQYTDLRGTVAIDGHSSVADLAKVAHAKGMPDKYIPVGFKVYGEWFVSDSVSMTVYAVEANQGETIDDVLRRSANGGLVPVDSFRFELPLNEVPQMVKRIEIVAKSEAVDSYELSVTSEHTLS